jgi:hypothetical protein
MAISEENTEIYRYIRFPISITPSSLASIQPDVNAVTTLIEGSFLFRDNPLNNDVQKVTSAKVLDLESRLIYITDVTGKITNIES